MTPGKGGPYDRRTVELGRNSGRVHGVEIRLLDEGDSLEDLTGLLNRAYGQLARMGLRYWATHQGVEDTKRRAEGGECWVAVLGGEIVGTVLFKGPGRTEGCAWYERKDVASIHQFAVEPRLQRRGIGSRMLRFVEERARETGAREIALDTSEEARHLIGIYERRGYRIVDEADWRPMVNYRSVITRDHVDAARSGAESGETGGGHQSLAVDVVLDHHGHPVERSARSF